MSSGAIGCGCAPVRIASISANRMRSSATVARYHGVSSCSVASCQARAKSTGLWACSRTTRRSSATWESPSAMPRPSDGFVHAHASATLATPEIGPAPLPA
jgi:hypothetical protein